MLQIPFFWQALLFSSFAIGAVSVSAWWLYLSPVQTPPRPAAPPSPGFVLIVALLLLLSGIQLVVGAFWDSSMHILTGEVPGGADFLWPPHIMIYSAFVIMLIVAGLALRVIAIPARRAGINDPRLWVRSNPYVGAVALAAMYGIFSIPGDAIWHLLFGIDLTAWSPPHVMLALSAALPLVATAGMVAHFRPQGGRQLGPALITSTLLAVGLNIIYIIGVIEFELPGRTSVTHAVPLWMYPTIGGGIAFFVLMLSKRLVPLHWAATLTAIMFFGIRLVISLVFAFTDQIVPYLPVGFLFGAILIDWLPWDKIASYPLRVLAIALAFALGFEFMAIPILVARPDMAFSTLDLVKIFIAMVAAGLVLLPAAGWVGMILLNEETVPQQVAAAAGAD